MNKKELNHIIDQFTNETFTRNEKDEFNQYRDYLNEFCVLAMFKYLNGKIEHRDDISHLDCEAEIHNELMDITAYSFIKTLQK